jgi:competence protein ComEA
VPLRLDPGRRGALGIGLAVAIAAVLTAVWLAAQRPQATAVSARIPAAAAAATPSGTDRPSHPAESAAASPSAAATPSVAGAAGPETPGPGSPSASSGSPGLVVVDVAGRVRRPGVYRLPTGARVDDAVTAAGGARAGVDLSDLNLAARLVDGQQILVGLPAASGAPAVGAAGAPAGEGAGSADPTGGSSSTTVDVNTATLTDLEALPGVGPVLAQHILDWRSAHGRFTSVDQLNDVSGIGDVKFAAMRAHVSI